MDTLSKLGLKYGTDKIGKHHYLPLYHEMFKGRRKSIKKVLEIGAGEGLGLRMFRDYFPNATIYGAEIQDNRIFKEDRIEVIKCNQTNYEDLKSLIDKVGSDIDIVIDDGSHKPEDQVFTCETVMRMINFGAIYIIEDVADATIVDKLDKFYPALIKVGERYDDQIIVMRIDE